MGFGLKDCKEKLMHPINYDKKIRLPQAGNPSGPALGSQYGRCINFEFYKNRAMKHGNKPYYFVANGWWHCISKADTPFPLLSMHVFPF